MALINLNKVSLKFPITSESGLSLRKHLIRLTTGGVISSEHDKTIYIQALSDINLQFSDGDRIGLIGHNGSGKSTLLKTMAGIYSPTSGTCLINGAVRTLFELGVGVDYELTGLQNIKRISRLLGYNLDKVEDDIAFIEDFTELGGFLDLPVRSYSSGMQLRLLFAISTMYPSDILLIDEVFGVGDEKFQNKAKQQMENIMNKSRIVVLATHSKELIQKFCNKTIQLEAGRVVEINEVKG